ncbi:MAG TPA: diguanylate cyclase [Nitrospirae bacterium]|nr:phytochrome-like protein cph2 [bacterium BMS3Abin09]HDY71410.1 diguanylate cyclase [Nitrospirota bacterium]
MKILIVEYDPISRLLLEKTLESWGHEITSAENGQEAWEIFQKSNYKFVISDWQMPVMDGLTLCRKIRSLKNSGYVYFILLTGKEKKREVIEGLYSGADDYFTKPFDREELKVRTRAGERILNLEKELNGKNEELLHLNAKLEEIAWIDPLMEIGNRRSFFESIKKTHHRAKRYAHNYGLVMCDIDNFKVYNDTYGHLQGDNALKQIAVTIKNLLRMSDDVYRFGGEEITIILQNQELEYTKEVAERIREKIESLRIEHKGSPVGFLTLSCGVAAFNAEDAARDWQHVLNRADKALYIAKSDGKNKVCLPKQIFKS